MKKQFISAIIIAGALALAQQGFSADDQEITDGGTLGANATLNDVSLSPGVTLRYDGDDDDTDGDTGSSYMMTTKNDQGPMAYAVEAGDTAVYQYDVGVDPDTETDWDPNDDDTTANSTLAGETDTSLNGDWTAMGQ
ncbi:MAG: hypothetical protein R6V20_02000 [Desulfobia sp.]